MDFKPVFRMLQDTFPQVDIRLLKAIAIEHSEEPAAAVNFIITDVLPSVRGPKKSSFAGHDHLKTTDSPVQSGISLNALLLHEGESPPASKPLSRTSDADTPTACPKSSALDKRVTNTSATNIDYHLVPTEEPEAEKTSGELVPSGELVNSEDLCRLETKCSESSLCDSQQCFSSLDENTSGRSTLENDLRSSSVLETDHLVSATSNSAQDVIWPTLADSFYLMELKTREAKGSNIPASEHETQKLPELSGRDTESLTIGTEGSNIPASEHETQKLPELSGRDTELLTIGTEGASVAEDTECAVAAIQYSQVGIDFLEGLINDSKNKKNMLVSAMESVYSMVKDVEFHEERAKQAKEEASTAGEDVLSKTEELKQMVKQAKEANDMHSGEVYGEKAILATEARELQTCLVKLSDKQGKSLSVISEIRQKLEARIAAAKEEEAAAEQKKLEKEQLARKLYNEQELIMGNIVQESERLKDAAEENTKLRDFLVDRGRALDVLQGEIGVFCEDVLLLKERVDGRIPLSRSYSRTSRSLASSLSSSYQKSVSNEEAAHSFCSSESPKTSSSEPSRSPQPASLAGLESSDDDWELCDKAANETSL